MVPPETAPAPVQEVGETVAETITTDTKGDELKRIGFVEKTACVAYGRATSLAYTVAKAAPAPVANVATSTYDSISPTVEPYAVKALEILKPTASKLLYSVDGKVDSICKYGEGVYSATAKSYESYKGLLSDGTKQFQEHFDAHFQAIDDFLQSLKGRLHLPSSKEAANLVSEKLTELRQMVGSASQAPREAVLAKVGQLRSSWEALLERKEVSDAIKYSNSSIASVKSRVGDIHDTVVADPRYSSLWDITGSWLTWAHNTTVGSTAMSYAAPVAERLAASSYGEKAKPYATGLYDWLKPAAALEGIETK